MRRLGAAAAAAHVRAQTRAAAYAEYWVGEVVPCLDAGFRPPILEGWRRFLQAPEVAEHLNERLTAQVPDGPGDPLPAAAVRLALGGDDEADDAPFAPMVPLAAVEGAALRGADPESAHELVEIAWERVPQAVWLPSLRSAAAGVAPALAGRSARDVRELIERGLPLHPLGAALAVALVEHGWEPAVEPGGFFAVSDGENVLLPLVVAQRIAVGDDEEGEWEALLEALGLEELPLAGEPAARAPAPPTRPVTASLSLVRTRRLRWTTLAALTVLAPMVLGVAAVCVLSLLEPGGEAALDTVALVTLAAMLAIGWWLATRTRMAFGRGRVAIGTEDVRIEDRRLLREAFTVPRGRVRAVAVDEAGAVDDAGGALRFPFGASTWSHPAGPELAADGWLWQAGAGPIPLLGAGDEVPNLLLVLDDPVPAPRMRLRGDSLPRGGDRLSAIALHVDDPATAHAAFTSWDVVRPLTLDDAHAALPAPPEELWAERSLRRGWGLAAFGILVPPLALWALFEAIGARESRRTEAAALALTAATVFTVRFGLYLGWF
jgi:hypothetical protein